LVGSYAVPDGVTTIGQDAFSYSTNLVAVTLPGSLATIAQGAFSYCSSLDGITLPNKVTSIGGEAFFSCTSLTNIIVPGSVTSVGDGAFDGCTGLARAALGNGVTNIGQYAFYLCANLTNVIIGNGLVSIEAEAFEDCTNLASVFFASNAPAVDFTAFANDPAGTAYYLPGTTNWQPTLAALPTVLWNPQIQVGDSSFGVKNHHFGFDIAGTANIPVVIESAPALDTPVWTTLQSLTLTNGLVFFSDPNSAGYRARYYRLTAP
jgi:hypothetical protein